MQNKSEEERNTQEVNSMEGVSSNAEKVYMAMKNGGVIGEEKMATAERITAISKLPKNMVLNALQELQSKNHVKRKAREKAAGYYLVQ